MLEPSYKFRPIIPSPAFIKPNPKRFSRSIWLLTCSRRRRGVVLSLFRAAWPQPALTSRLRPTPSSLRNWHPPPRSRGRRGGLPPPRRRSPQRHHVSFASSSGGARSDSGDFVQLPSRSRLPGYIGPCHLGRDLHLRSV